MSRVPYQYIVLRCVPRADREEFLNLGVVVYCEESGFLALASHVDEARLLALDPTLDVAQVGAALDFVHRVCVGDTLAGAVAAEPPGARFGFVKAPRSTVVRSGPVHGGITDDPTAELAKLLASLVG